jgi:hypothetical protein
VFAGTPAKEHTNLEPLLVWSHENIFSEKTRLLKGRPAPSFHRRLPIPLRREIEFDGG